MHFNLHSCHILEPKAEQGYFKATASKKYFEKAVGVCNLPSLLHPVKFRVNAELRMQGKDSTAVAVHHHQGDQARTCPAHCACHRFITLIWVMVNLHHSQNC